MNQLQFEKNYNNQWLRFAETLATLEGNSRKKTDERPDASAFPRQYRKICSHYGLAQSRHYSPALVTRLHDLVLRGHRQLYRERKGILVPAINFLFRDFPRTLRRYRIAFFIAFALFYLPAFTFGTAAWHNPVLVYSFMDENEIFTMEEMYSPDNPTIGRTKKRTAETNITMFGYYIRNNISIGFRTFAGGIIFGIGSIFYLVFNGLMIGGVAGHLSHPPYQDIFWPFVCGHGPYELTAIVISGAAGLLLGYSLLCPGRHSRGDALRIAARPALRLIIGAAIMFAIAALFEAFWSPSRTFPAQTKYAVAVCNWVIVIAYFLFAGRNR